MLIRRVLASVSLLCFPTFVQAQVSTGVPAYGSFGGGPFDTVNLGNLNVHFAIPILHKAGRGMPFTYSLGYDSSIWVSVTSGGTTKWQPVGSWGWTADTAAVSGYVTATETTGRSNSPCTGSSTDVYSNYVYHDSLGRTHPFSGSTHLNYYPCLHPPVSASGEVSSTASDGSGYTLTANMATWSVTSATGVVTTGPINGQSAAATITDANGNKLSANTSGQFFDTLSSTTPVLTRTNTSTSDTYSYMAPSGANASYVVNYKSYTVATNFGFSGITEYSPTSVLLIDNIQLPDGTSYSFQYETTPGSCTPLSGTYATNCVTGRMTSITLPTSGVITYAYSGGTNSTGIFSDGSTSTLTRSLSPNTCGSGGCWRYERALQGSTAPGPGSLWTTTISDPQGNYTVNNFSEDSGSTYNLYETQSQVYQGSISPGNLLVTRLKCYNGIYTSCATAHVSSPIYTKDDYKTLPNGITRMSHIIYDGAYSGSGLVSARWEYGFGVTAGASPGSAYLVKKTTTSYATLGNGIINKPSSITVTDLTSGSPVAVAQTNYTYDESSVTATSGTPQHTSITGSRGNLTTLATSVNGSTTLYRKFTYYDTGKPYTSTAVSTSATTAGATTTYVYGSGSCGNSFATTVNEPLSLSRSTSWNCVGGVATGQTDENSQNVTENYTDAYFWRPSSMVDQETNPTSITYTGENSEDISLSFNSGASIVDSLSTVDGFGRPILQQAKQSPTATNYDTTETDYNVLGQPYETTMPFSASAGATNSSAPRTQRQYDALGRRLSITKPDTGTVSYTYTNNDVLKVVGSSTPGIQSFKKNFEYDGMGRLVSVCEISSLPGTGSCGQSVTYTGYLTKYTYDALGHLRTVTQNAQASSGQQQTRVFTYDWLGRMMSESNPETSNTGSNGTTTYTFDIASGSCAASAGNMTTKLDPAGNTTCYTYDALSRLTLAGSSSPTSSSVCRRYTYDNNPTPYNSGTAPSGISVSNTKTRLKEASTDNCSLTSLQTDEWFSYSPRGEVTDVYEATPHSGGYYHTTASYWSTGALETLSGIPSVPILTYGGLDGEGRYTQVNASAGTNPISSVTYSSSSTTNPLGALTNVTYGSSDSDAFSYDPGTGRFLTYSFSVGTASDNGTLTWSPNGTLSSLSIADGIAGTNDSQTCGFTYDDLGRVGGQNANGYSVDCGSSTWQQAFSYDAFGNINKSSSGGVSFTPSYNTLNQITTGGMGSYDGNGNMLTDINNLYTWDANWGTLSSVNGSAITYDAMGQMVELNNGASQVLYSPIGKTAIMSGATLTKAFVGLPGGGTAVYDSTGLVYYRHSDWLGSSRLASTPSQTLYSSTAYAPFGEAYATAGTTDQSFTGQDSDTATTLYDFAARRHNPAMGRWISPDPSGISAVNIRNPQSWNRFAYVTNRPMNRVDPLGLNEEADCLDPDDPFCGSDGSGGGGVGGGDGDGGDPGYGPDPGSGGSDDPNNPGNCVPNDPNCASVGGGVPDDPCELCLSSDPGGYIPSQDPGSLDPNNVNFSQTQPPINPLRVDNYYNATCYGNPMANSKYSCAMVCTATEQWGPFEEFPTLGVMDFTQKQLGPACGPLSEVFCPSKITIEGNYNPYTGIAPNPYINTCKM